VELIRDVVQEHATERHSNADLYLPEGSAITEAYQEEDGDEGGDDQEEQSENGFVADELVGVPGFKGELGELSLIKAVQ